MPERWERELSKLRHVRPTEAVVRGRVASGPRGDGPRSRADRIVAGVVAGLVAVAAAAFLWRILPGPSDGVGDIAAQLPVLSVSFHDSEVIPEGPDSSYRRVQTSIAYGDARDEDFTTTTPANATVEWVAAEDLTHFVPGPTVGSRVAFDADGDAPRALIGTPDQWPDFERFTAIDRLPDTPGDYILVFEADYPEGIARTARYVRLVDPGVLQLVVQEGGNADADATGKAFVDGRGTAGFLSEWSFMEGDSGTVSVTHAPEFAPDAWLGVPPGSRMDLVSPATTAMSGFFESYQAFDPKEPLPVDLLQRGASIDAATGRWLLAVEMTWVHPAPGTGDYRATERALFFFPIEIVGTEEPESTVEPSLTPTHAPEEHVSPSPSVGSGQEDAAPALRVRCEPYGAEVLTPVVATQVDGLHIIPVDVPADWEIGLFPASEERVSYWAGSDDTDDGFVRPVPPGEVSIACLDKEMYSEADMERMEANAAAFVLQDEESFFTPYEPECDIADQTAVDWTLGVVVDDAAERLRALPGVQEDDVIELAGYDREWGSARIWRIVRDGRIVAGLRVGEQGGGVVHGWVCRESGIRGEEF